MEWTEKIWETKRILMEPVCFAEQDDGSLSGGQLLFPPKAIESVTSHDCTIQYQEGRDYAVQNGRLIRTPDSRIPILPRAEYCKVYDGAKETAWLRLADGNRYMAISPTVYQYQILVTYTHDAAWEGAIPADGSAALAHSLKKLQAGGPFNLLFYGDSITAGWEASGCDEEVINMRDCRAFPLRINRPPYVPSWPELVTRGLRAAYPQADIRKTNRGVGGSTTVWGVEHAAELVCPQHPDLVILGFGMNSLRDPATLYRSQIEAIIHAIRAEAPECDFLLVSPMVPNTEIAGLAENKLAQQEAALWDLAHAETGITVAPVHEISEELLHRGKTYYELTGNCINHPNDFSVRLYAQTVLAALGR